MTPYETARQWYEDHPQECSFSHYLIDCALNGFVFITPEFFIMGKATNRALLERGESTVGNDTWHVVFACGSLAKAWSILPYELPYMAFERVRDGELCLTVMLLERLRDKTESKCSTTH